MKLATVEQVQELRASSHKRQAADELGPLLYDCWLIGIIRYLEARRKRQASSLELTSWSKNKPQASSPEQQASSVKPQAASCSICSPRKSFTSLEARCFTKINELYGWVTWKAIWCGESRILLPVHTFSSTVKKTPFLLYPNRSGTPGTLKFSILVHLILVIFLRTSCQNFVSGFNVSTVS